MWWTCEGGKPFHDLLEVGYCTSCESMVQEISNGRTHVSRTPKPEYLIARSQLTWGSVGKVPFNFWWRREIPQFSTPHRGFPHENINQPVVDVDVVNGLSLGIVQKWKVTLPKTNNDTQNDGLEKVTPLKHGNFWYQFVRFLGWKLFFQVIQPPWPNLIPDSLEVTNNNLWVRVTWTHSPGPKKVMLNHLGFKGIYQGTSGRVYP